MRVPVLRASSRFARMKSACLAVIVATAASGAWAGDGPSIPINAAPGLTFSSSKTEAPGPLAVRGYDVVSYFTEGAPRLGTSAHAANHGGTIYWFASAENLAKFKAAPERYLPQYGGYCAFGVTQKTKFDGDPNIWTVHKGKLYFNVTPQIQAMFNKDVAGSVAAADKIWPTIQSADPAALFRVWAAKQKK